MLPLRTRFRMPCSSASLIIAIKTKGKGKGHPRTGHEDPEGEQRYSSTLSLTSALDGVGGQRHAPAALPPGMTRYPLYRTLGRPQGRSGRMLKISPPPGLDLRTVHLVANRYTDYAIPVHLKQKVKINFAWSPFCHSRLYNLSYFSKLYNHESFHALLASDASVASSSVVRSTAILLLLIQEIKIYAVEMGFSGMILVQVS